VNAFQPEGNPNVIHLVVSMSQPGITLRWGDDVGDQPQLLFLRDCCALSSLLSPNSSRAALHTTFGSSIRLLIFTQKL
jgi:hypothetical protein